MKTANEPMLRMEYEDLNKQLTSTGELSVYILQRGNEFNLEP